MDLTFFIICIILIYLIYYLINCIQSLNKELKEVKNKCINVENGSKLEVNTPDVEKELGDKTINLIDFMKKMFVK